MLIIDARWKGREVLKAEDDLVAYDMKVYKAQVQMVTHMETQLHELGVPFFGIPSRLILKDDSEQTGDAKISSKDLRSLQIRMLQHLKDMYE